MTIPANTVIMRRGDPCHHFFLIEEGTIRVYQRTEDGRDHAASRGASEICIFTLQALLENMDDEVELVSENQVRIANILQ